MIIFLFKFDDGKYHKFCEKKHELKGRKIEAVGKVTIKRQIRDN